MEHFGGIPPILDFDERQLAAMVEAVVEGYKNSHPDEPSGNSNHCDPYSNGNHDSSRLCHQGLSGSNTSLPQRSPALEQCTSSTWTPDTTNIITEATSVNGGIDAEKVKANLDNAIRTLALNDKWFQLQSGRLKSSNLGNVCNGLRAILHYALTGSKVENFEKSEYANITGPVQSGILAQEYDGVLLSIRLSDHFTKVDKLKSHEAEQQYEPKQRLSIVANNTEKTNQLLKSLPSSEKRNVAQEFDADPSIVRTEIAFNLAELAIKSRSTGKTATLLQAIFKFLKRTLDKDCVLGSLSVVLQHAYPKIITAYQIDDDGNTYVNGEKQQLRKPNSVSEHQPSSSEAMPESVMDACQRVYAAFLESVCNKFNCPSEARVRLQTGFRAYCKATQAQS